MGGDLSTSTVWSLPLASFVSKIFLLLPPASSSIAITREHSFSASGSSQYKSTGQLWAATQCEQPRHQLRAYIVSTSNWDGFAWHQTHSCALRSAMWSALTRWTPLASPLSGVAMKQKQKQRIFRNLWAWKCQPHRILSNCSVLGQNQGLICTRPPPLWV